MQKSVIAILLLSTAAAFANEAGDEMANRTSSISERTRSAMRAEVRQLGGPGTRSVSELDRNQAQAARGVSRSRAEVRIEAVEAARAHLIHELY